MSESGVDKGRDLVNSIKSQKLETKDQSLDMNDLVDKSSLETESFNEVDYAAMLTNTHIRMAVGGLANKIAFSNEIIGKLRNIILKDESGSSQRIISQIFVLYPGSSLDVIKSKLDYYQSLTSREDINHFLKLLNDKIKRSVFDSSLNEYFDKKNLDQLIVSIDQLTDNLHSSVIPFIGLGSLKADDLKESFSEDNKLSSSVKKLNDCSSYHALLKGQLVIVAAPPGVGKTQFMMNETYHHAKDGKKVVYLAMGDSLQSDFTIKLGCIHFNVDVQGFLKDIEKYMKDSEFLRILNNINLSVVSAGELRSGDVRRFYKADAELSKADVYFFDYDSNFAELSETDMYSAHDIIYNNLYALARLPHPKLVYVASQVKTGYYKSEFIPLQALAESNRKQAIADYVVTISGIKDEIKNCGIFNIVKARRGRLGFTAYMLAKSGRIIEIDMQMYRTQKAEILSNRATSVETD
ncbi:hexameric helicase [Yersinia phage vB_Yru_GN1]|uniref:Hexameric helicase n=1 Tax=Yersinia phage vB_Yru_GN1 TaxID=3074381 RepID=A0AA86J556_9CAUD|nr:hexameric helicase [Yersinia phage vB_Yru_GN1]